MVHHGKMDNQRRRSSRVDSLKISTDTIVIAFFKTVTGVSIEQVLEILGVFLCCFKVGFIDTYPDFAAADILP